VGGVFWLEKHAGGFAEIELLDRFFEGIEHLHRLLYFTDYVSPQRCRRVKNNGLFCCLILILGLGLLISLLFCL